MRKKEQKSTRCEVKKKKSRSLEPTESILTRKNSHGN